MKEILWDMVNALSPWRLTIRAPTERIILKQHANGHLQSVNYVGSKRISLSTYVGGN